MPPKSRGSAIPSGFQSRSTPNLPKLKTLLRPAIPHHSQGQHGCQQNHAEAGQAEKQSGVETTEGHDIGADDGEDRNLFTFDKASSASSSEAEDAEDGQYVPPKRPLYTHASRSYTSLPPQTNSSMLFPPFYNRPPAPLPPSPSLTSLLRPSFSTQASRPTTPDSSDVEFVDTAPSGEGTPISSNTTTVDIHKSARLAPTSVPQASPQVPTYEYYGYALYLASSAAFIMYLLWAYLPSPFLELIGIRYYPNRWWALAIPAWLVMLIIFIYIALALYNMEVLTLPMSSLENMVDEAGAIACVDPRTGQILKNGLRPGGVPQSSPTTQGLSTPKAASKTNARTQKWSNSSNVKPYWGEGRPLYSFGQHVDPTAWSIGTDAVLDIPIGAVNAILYGQDPSQMAKEMELGID